MTRRRPSDFEPWEETAFGASDVPGCPPPDSLLPAVEGTLPEPALSRVRRHVAACPLCAELVAAFEAAIAEPLTPAETARLEARRVGRRSWAAGWWPAAAAAALVIASGWVIQFPAIVPAVPPDRPAAAGRESATAHVLRVEPPAIELPRTPIVLRGQPADPYLSALIGALEPFRARDYAEAGRRLSALEAREPGRPHAFYYRGVSALLAGDAAASIEPLERARALAAPGTSLHTDASWYLAAALERLGRRSDSIGVLTALCGSAGDSDERVCLALHALLSR